MKKDRVEDNDEVFLAYALENGILDKYELFDIGVDEWSYYDFSDDVIDRVESYKYFKDKKK